MLNTNEALELLKESTGTSELGIRSLESFNKDSSQSGRKFKMQNNTTFGVAIKCELRLPFDPVRFDQDLGFSKKNPYITDMLPTDVVKAVKGLCSTNKAALDFYNEQFGEIWDVSNPEVVNEKDIKLWQKWKSIYHISRKTQKMQFSSSPSKFGEEYRSNVRYNEEGVIDPKSIDLGYKLYELEKDFAFKKLAEINERVENGDLKGKDAESVKVLKKSVFQTMKVKEPRDKGIVRMIAFKLDSDNREGVSEDNPILDVDSGLALSKFDFNWTGCEKIKEELESVIGSKRDTDLNYIFGRLSFKDHSDIEEKQRALKLFTTMTFDWKPENRPTELLPGFNTYYEEFGRNPKFNGDKYMNRSVIQFRQIDDHTLLEKYKVELEYKEDLVDEEIMKRHSQVISQASEAFSASMIEKILEGATKETISISDVASEGGDVIKELDDELASDAFPTELDLEMEDM